MSNKKRSFWFNLLMIILIILIGGIIFRGYELYVTNDFLFQEMMDDEEEYVMPSWYPIATLAFGVLALIGIILCYLFKKIGVYITIASLVISLIMQPYFMPDGTLYTLFALFVFVGCGLAVIIPRWEEYS